MNDEVFCESCNSRCKKSLAAWKLTPPDDDDEIDQLISGRLDVLHTLNSVDDDDDPNLRIDTWRCSSCEQTAAVRARLHALDTALLEKEEKIWTLIPIRLVSPAAIDRLDAALRRNELVAN